MIRYITPPMTIHIHSPLTRHGFTLVEVLITVGIVSFVLPVVIMVLVIILRQQLTVARLTQVKRQGDQALAVIRTVIEREAQSMYASSGPGYSSVCTTVETTPRIVAGFVTATGAQVRFTADPDSGSLRKQTDSDVPEELIDTSKVRVTTDGIKIQCIKPASYSHALVSVEYTLVPALFIANEDQSALSMSYRSMIVLRR